MCNIVNKLKYISIFLPNIPCMHVKLWEISLLYNEQCGKKPTKMTFFSGEGLALDHSRSGFLKSLCLHPAPIPMVRAGSRGSIRRTGAHHDQRRCAHKRTFKLSELLPSRKARLFLPKEEHTFCATLVCEMAPL